MEVTALHFYAVKRRENDGGTSEPGAEQGQHGRVEDPQSADLGVSLPPQRGVTLSQRSIGGHIQVSSQRGRGGLASK